MTRSIVVNGRFLRRRPTGLHRVARALLDHTTGPGLEFEVLAPPGVDDPRVDRVLWSPPGRLGDHVWEQGALPAAARGRVVLSLANTAPIAARGAVMVHDLAPLVNPDWFKHEMRLYAWIALAAARRARVVLTVSDEIADELSRWGVDSGSIRVVRNAVDDRFRPAAASDVERVRRRFGIGEPYLLVVGWADPRKDTTTAIAAHALAAGHRHHELVLAGTPERNFAPVRFPDFPTVRKVGYVPDDDLVALMTGATAFVYPSRYEGFGLPPLEAIACGTPALVSDLPVLRESTEGRAVFVPAGDVNAWSEAFVAALDGSFAAPEASAWTWDDAGAVLGTALGELRHDSVV